MHERSGASQGTIHLIGGGIASLAAAVLLIRDAGVSGQRIVIYEQTDRLGGGPDKAGIGEGGFVLRPSRHFESKYLCMYDLFSAIPTLDGRRTVTREIFERNYASRGCCNGVVIRGGSRVVSLAPELAEEHLHALELLGQESEQGLGSQGIADYFVSSFFQTAFWMVLQSTFNFQPWHSLAEFRRVLLRFIPITASFRGLQGSMRLFFEQYELLIRPLERWLRQQQVSIALNTRVADLAFTHEAQATYFVESLAVEDADGRHTVELTRNDLVIATLANPCERNVFGSMACAPGEASSSGLSPSLWSRIAEGSDLFGRPAVFRGGEKESAVVGFSVTIHETSLLRSMRELTGPDGGTVALADSRWTLSLALPPCPRRKRRGSVTNVLWGFGLSIDVPGDHVTKAMRSCAGWEIMKEVLGHVGIRRAAAKLTAACTCVPCLMPSGTSALLPRSKGDRPKVLPAGSGNLAFTGQFCELPEEITLTTEYSIRSAYAAVYALLGIPRVPSPVFKGRYDPRVFVAQGDYS